MDGYLTTGKLALKLGVQEHHIRALARHGCIPFEQAGTYRFFAVADVEKIREACIEAGYLKSKAEVLARAAN